MRMSSQEPTNLYICLYHEFISCHIGHYLSTISRFRPRMRLHSYCFIVDFMCLGSRRNRRINHPQSPKLVWTLSPPSTYGIWVLRHMMQQLLCNSNSFNTP